MWTTIGVAVLAYGFGLLSGVLVFRFAIEAREEPARERLLAERGLEIAELERRLRAELAAEGGRVAREESRADATPSERQSRRA
jgi:hypothetical protein